jgi:DNA phosphorothioation-associated putative methyltransferase
MSESSVQIERHKTAIRRTAASAPIKLAVQNQLISPGVTVLDYGCGHGEDLRFLASHGIECDGWDPAFRVSGPRYPADVVNLGYVINVIEDPIEREQTLRSAWNLCRRLLIVAAQILVSGRGDKQIEFGDGVITRRGTFQKFFTQPELREFIESGLQTEAIPATPGIFFVFRDETLRESFLDRRYRRRSQETKCPTAEDRFERARELLDPLMRTIEELGRVPIASEFPIAAEVTSTFGSLNRAFSIIRRVTGSHRWDVLRRRRTDDLLIYMALARFRKRPPLAKLPSVLQQDIREFFGTYRKACSLADELLYRAGNASAVDEGCRLSLVGKLLPNALYVHRSAIEALAPLLRVYEGCARAVLGEIEGANVIKMHRFSGKVSYLFYPDFDIDPHPALIRSVKLAMRTQELDCIEYTGSDSPPILHRKETFVEPTYPLYAKFRRLTRQEEKYGLLDEAQSIGTKLAWEERLRRSGFVIRGHRLMRLRAAQ